MGCIWIVKGRSAGEIEIVHEGPDGNGEGLPSRFSWWGPPLAVGFRIDLGPFGDAGTLMGDAMKLYEKRITEDRAFWKQKIYPVIGEPGTFKLEDGRVLRLADFMAEVPKPIALAVDPAPSPDELASKSEVVRYPGRAEGPVVAGAVTGPWTRISREQQILNDALVENIDNWGKDLAGIVPCLRCGGPAGYLGIRCERVGGCRAAEERVGEPFEVREWSKDGEPRFTALGRIPGRSPEHWIQVVRPSRALAIQVWRETVLKELNR